MDEYKKFLKADGQSQDDIKQTIQLAGFQTASGAFDPVSFAKFEQLLLTVPTSRQDIVAVAFCTVDGNHNGSITIKEIKKFLKGEGYSNKQVKDTLKLIKPYMDTNMKLDLDAFSKVLDKVSISPIKKRTASQKKSEMNKKKT